MAIRPGGMSRAIWTASASLLIGICLLCGACTLSQSGQAATGAVGSSAQDASLEQATIVHVVDGDTLKVRFADGSTDKVRLIGINAPESVAEDESRNCEEGVEASDYMKSLVSPGTTVFLQKDVSDEDQYGRLLRYVWLEKPDDADDENEVKTKMLNAILVENGYAQARRYKPDTAYNDLFEEWGDEAIDEGLGVSYYWA